MHIKIDSPHRSNHRFALWHCMAILMLLYTPIVMAAKPVHDWKMWLKQIRTQALADGIKANVFDAAFTNLTPDQQVLRLDRSQPEKRLTFLEYRKSRIDGNRIKLGRQKYRQYKALLHEISDEYGVNPCVIVALWGMESSYGGYKGNFPVIRSLATLAFEGRRGDFFKNELLIALHILQEGDVSPAEFKGEWAGGSGHPQFLPSSWQKYAVDYDKDGKKNIWTSLDDALASIANYLKVNGWEKNQPSAFEVNAPSTLPRGFDAPAQPLEKWLQMGVQIRSPKRSQEYNKLTAWLIEPSGGPTLLVFNNFNVIKTYNNSDYYAGSIGYLADQICGV